ncbi:unnamed protein product, partial [Cuscuta europaea]
MAKCIAGPRIYGIMTSNCAESLNKVNVYTREYSVCKLVDSLRERMQQWFTERSEEALITSTFLSPKRENHLVALQAQSTCIQVKPTFYFEFEVVDRYCRSFVVNLNHKTCTCGVFQLGQFVCAHAVAAIRVRPRLSCYDFISPIYSRDSWFSTWSAVVHPIVDPQSWLVPQDVRDKICKPPNCLKRPAGRPKKTTIPFVGEFRGSGSKRQKCSRCHVLGHNKKSCR